jgi:hypothetical protein
MKLQINDEHKVQEKPIEPTWLYKIRQTKVYGLQVRALITGIMVTIYQAKNVVYVNTQKEANT